jgi:hypothetical protein
MQTSISNSGNRVTECNMIFNWKFYFNSSYHQTPRAHSPLNQAVNYSWTPNRQQRLPN